MKTILKTALPLTLAAIAAWLAIEGLKHLSEKVKAEKAAQRIRTAQAAQRSKVAAMQQEEQDADSVI